MTEAVRQTPNLARRHQLMAAAILLIVAAGVAFLILYPVHRDLNLCDNAIKETLKAPATYKRVEAPGAYSEIGVYDISYDAENGFGVPLRSKGFCHVNADRSGANWAEIPDVRS